MIPFLFMHEAESSGLALWKLTAECASSTGPFYAFGGRWNAAVTAFPAGPQWVSSPEHHASLFLSVMWWVWTLNQLFESGLHLLAMWP
jgi:hypothetical protein